MSLNKDSGKHLENDYLLYLIKTPTGRETVWTNGSFVWSIIDNKNILTTLPYDEY